MNHPENEKRAMKLKYRRIKLKNADDQNPITEGKTNYSMCLKL